MRFRMRPSDVLFGFLLVVYLIAISTIVFDATPNLGEAAAILLLAPVLGLAILAYTVAAIVTGDLNAAMLGGILIGACLAAALVISLIRCAWEARGIRFIDENVRVAGPPRRLPENS